MNFDFSDDLKQLRDQARRFLAERSSPPVVRSVLEASGVIVYRADTLEQVVPTVEAALLLAFQSRRGVAVLLSQKLIGAKNFVRGDK